MGKLWSFHPCRDSHVLVIDYAHSSDSMEYPPLEVSVTFCCLELQKGCLVGKAGVKNQAHV